MSTASLSVLSTPGGPVVVIDGVEQEPEAIVRLSAHDLAAIVETNRTAGFDAGVRHVAAAGPVTGISTILRDSSGKAIGTVEHAPPKPKPAPRRPTGDLPARNV